VDMLIEGGVVCVGLEIVVLRGCSRVLVECWLSVCSAGEKAGWCD
jgi:hypothetical protein